MKNYFHILLLALFILVSCKNFGQENNNTLNEEHHISMKEFPTNMAINHLDNWGGMAVGLNEIPAGTDVTSLFEGLKNNSCQVPHWGYILKGVVRIIYDDGKETLLKAGDIFYMPPGHTAIFVEDLKFIDFSPQKEFTDLMSHIDKKMEEADKK